jgi:tetratricopeptide (TPR) repeat protein
MLTAHSLHRTIVAVALTTTLAASVSLARAGTSTGVIRPAADPAAAMIQFGFDHGDAASILKARGLLLGRLAGSPRSASLHYWVAVAAWRAVPLLSKTDKGGARRLCEEGLAHCDAALGTEPRLAEALALKAGLQGLSIQFDGAAAMVLGPQMASNMGRAAGMAPDDPRVQLLDAINTFHTPAFFGGGPDQALPKLARALELFASQPADSTTAGWGYDDAHAWAGRAEASRDSLVAAREHYRRALALNPANGWVRTSLLPEVERALAKKDSTGS